MAAKFRGKYRGGVPKIEAELVRPSDKSRIRHEFILDTGSIYSYAPLSLALAMGMDVPDTDEELQKLSESPDLPCYDLSGKKIDICLKGKFTIWLDEWWFEEVIYFRKNLKYSVLGHSATLRRHPMFVMGGSGETGHYILFEKKSVPPDLKPTGPTK